MRDGRCGCGEEDPRDDRLAIGPPLAFVPDDAVAGDWMVRSAARRAIWLVTPGLLDDFRSTGARPTRSVAPIRSRP